MISFPLITRELLVQSRQRTTYDGRLGWGIAALAILAFFVWQSPQLSTNGRHMLTLLHGCLAIMLAFLAPIGSADSISRERREGTLGLLLLTNLSPRQIVVGKLGAHTIRVFYFFLLMAPFLMLPIFLGGVAFEDVLFSASVLISIAVTGLAAGLIASSRCKGFGAALFLAMFLFAVLITLTSSTVANAAFSIFPNRWSDDSPLSFRIFALGPLMMLFPLQARDFAGTAFASRWVYPAAGLALIPLSLMVLRIAIRRAARTISAHDELAITSQELETFRALFLQPVVWRGRFRRMMSRRLDRNPFIWLEYRTKWAPSARWMMLLIAIWAENIVLGSETEGVVEVNFGLLFALLAFLALKSSSSFQQEKESGTLELLLIAPITASRLVWGRMIGLASYYAPVVAVLVCFGIPAFLWSDGRLWYSPGIATAVTFTSLVGSLISVPICGLFFAMRCRTFFPALLWTAGVGIFLPICLWSAVNGLLWMAARSASWSRAAQLDAALREASLLPLTAIVVYHLLLASACWWRSIQLLRDRQFWSNR